VTACTVSGTGAGGIAGTFFSGSVSRAVAYVNVSGTKAGGIIGSDAQGGDINQTKITGNITGNNAGGIVGGDSQAGTVISNCYSLATVINATAGGFKGNDSAYVGSLTMQNNYFLGAIALGTSIGSLTLDNQLEIQNFASSSTYSDLNESQSLLCNYNVERFGNVSSFVGTNNVIYRYIYQASNNSLYAVGDFTSINGVSTDINGYAFNRVARYSFTDNRWYALANGVDGIVYTIHAYDATNIYIGGSFVNATQTNGSTLTVNNIALFNTTTSTWSALSNTAAGVAGGEVRAIVNIGTTLYVGGAFTSAGGDVTVSAIAKYGPIGSSPVWAPLEASATGSGFVVTLCVSGPDIYLGGTFTSLTDADGTKIMNRIALWNDSTSRFEYLGGNTGTTNGVNNQVNSIILDTNGTDIWVGGTFTNASTAAQTQAFLYLVKWNVGTSSWSSPLNVGIAANVNALYRNGNELHIGGTFGSRVNGYLTKNYYIMYDLSNGRFNSYNYQLFGSGGVVRTIMKVGDYVYLGGVFTTLNSSNAGTGTDYLTNVGNMCQLNTNYNTTAYTTSYPSSNTPISNFNS
jgi:hypothetical protein